MLYSITRKQIQRFTVVQNMSTNEYLFDENTFSFRVKQMTQIIIIVMFPSNNE